MRTEPPLVNMEKAGKRLGENRILKNVSLQVEEGETVGVVGTNGSGKTTLLRLISGLSYLSEGEIQIMGKTLKPGILGNLPGDIGVLIETPSFLNNQTGLENLVHLAQIKKKISKEEIKEAMRKVGLSPESKKKVRQYSLGMRQRLGIAQALMEKPSLVLFDEPINGLDSGGRELFNNYVEELKKQGTGYVFVSHHEHEIEAFCDRVFKIEDETLVVERKIKNVPIQLVNSVDVEKVLTAAPDATMGDRVNEMTVMLIPFSEGTKEEIDKFFKKIGVEYLFVDKDYK